ncbi:hypothetical protein DICVIV_07365 [Dictyocaulus viviparus]|uniref:Uncharacterized protein n=1 Tax=Dictyocaulus viviparus TaxID=29172 RepID=A0A0D8XS09_DICVI|nr:hypothetical protein DICVIV_07365 [Dictyocaulus viviparus]
MFLSFLRSIQICFRLSFETYCSYGEKVFFFFLFFLCLLLSSLTHCKRCFIVLRCFSIVSSSFQFVIVLFFLLSSKKVQM